MKQIVVFSLRPACLHAALVLTLAGTGIRAHAEPSAQQEPTGVLTLPRALELALAQHPALAAARLGVLGAEAEALQAGARSNPELELEVSEFGGSGARAGVDAAETAVRLSQSLDVGGTRVKRQRVARLEARLAGWDGEAIRLDVLAHTKKAFVDVLLAQGQLALSESVLAVAEDVRKAVSERVKAGKVPLLEETKAAVEVASARIERNRAMRDLDLAKKGLAASWGASAPGFTAAGGDLDRVAEVPSLETLSARLAGAPEVARWTDERAVAEEALALARAERIPDVTISAGISRFEEDGTTAGTLGLSLSLPLFNRHAGAIASAGYRASGVECEERLARLRARAELAEAYGRLDTARAEAATMKADLLPGAQQAFEAAEAGYREGKFGYLEVLDTQRTLHESRIRHLDVLADFHKAVADVERLTGLTIETIH